MAAYGITREKKLAKLSLVARFLDPQGVGT